MALPKETVEERDRRLALEDRTRELGRLIGAGLSPGIGFSLHLFTFGGGGSLAYISNADREDMIKALRELIARLERGQS